MNKDKRNNIQLLGTLNNADESGIIANANQIYDANEDKSTQDVSKEHKERIETLETKESSMQTTLENITKTGEASAASNVTYNHNDSNLDATNVQQAVDKVKALLDNKANKVDVVFDISAYHATGGTLATYADLTAALGTNGENIPQSLRKGGMSVKFVQSSDNKYVQYRLMSDSFGTIESDWQNIGLAQQIGLSETVAMSQKAVTDELNKIDARTRMTEITWANLKQLRDNGQLIPGMQYRIIDYDCHTTQKDTQSAGHQFDIIVTADSTNKLNEVARAIQHEGDEYFSNCNLAAWKIWYCLDNDTTRFAWADATNGKGVIYRMIDEWNNDCPYDFKNIQFKRYKITAAKSSDLVGTYLGVNDSDRGISIDSNDSKMFYTFSYLGELEDSTSYGGEVLQDASIVGNTLSSDVKSPYGVYNNSIKQFYDSNIASKETIQSLNSIVFLTFIIEEDGAYYGCYSNSFDNSCYYNSFGDNCSSNSFGDSCYYNSFGNNCSSNSFGNGCSSNSFDNSCYYNSFGNNCSSNSFDNSCYSNSFGNNCRSNSFDNSCGSNSFGDGCYSNSFGDSCYYNSFGNSCSSNSFGNGCSSNSFDNSCYYNSFGNNCNSNSFDNSCYSNSFGNNCSSNSFDNGCRSNSFGDSCYSNSFGDSCYCNSFVKECYSNSFGSNSSYNKLDAYYTRNIFDNGVQYVAFSGIGAIIKCVQNYHIKQGMTFTNDSIHTITARPGLGYELSVAKQTDGTVVEYCEADLLKK